jgi:hypothetical protein
VVDLVEHEFPCWDADTLAAFSTSVVTPLARRLATRPTP